MKRFKEMKCPVCGKFYFSSPSKDDYEEELSEYLKGEIYCSVCGWIYDLDQTENPDSNDGFNELSLNKYIEWYKQKILDNANYNFDEENRPKPIPHKCPVCGQHTFPETNSYEICPVCGWEDEEYFDGGGANELSLEDAIKEFENKK